MKLEILEKIFFIDLMFLILKLEPLNKRTEDIPLLFEYFMEKLSEIYNIKKLKLKILIFFKL